MMTRNQYMKLVGKVKNDMPDEPAFIWMESCQMLGDYVAKLGSKASEEDLALLVGIGALLSRQGFREFQAQGMAAALFRSVPL